MMFYKITRWLESITIYFSALLGITTFPERFINWKDTKNYIGKPVIACLVEQPDVKGVMTGFRVLADMNGEIFHCSIRINGGDSWFDYYKCRPQVNKKV